MKDITSKFETLRIALAEAFLSTSPEVLTLLREGKTEKGNALEVARTAGILGAKRTWEIIPFCHPIPLTHVDITYDFEKEGIRIQAYVKSIAPTGVEMEALAAVTLTALTLYDMLKPHTQELEIRGIRLLEKKGGKSDFRKSLVPPLRAAVMVLSDTVAAGKKPDKAGKTVVEHLRSEGVEVEGYEILPDDPERLRERLNHWLEAKVDLVVTVGGTGLGPKDRTVETVRPLLEREIPGIMEAARAYGQRRTPYAMLSRGVAGMIGSTLVLTFPGSSRGAQETCQALFPAVFHIFDVLRRVPHPQGYR